MTIETAAFINSLIFLTGIIALIIGSFPKVRAKLPRLFFSGFLIALSSFVLMLLAAFILR